MPTAPEGGTGRALSLAGGSGQVAPAGTPLPQPIEVLVRRRSDGAPDPGVAVDFRVTGGGTLSAAQALTDASGRARVVWTLGPRAGSGIHGVEALLAGAQGSPVRFTATAVAGPAVRLAPDSVTLGQRAAPGTALPQPIAAFARDALGNGVPGVAITWRVVQGGGAVTPATVVTNADGRAAAAWTLGAEGPQALAIESAGLPASAATATLVDLAVTGVSVDTLVPGRAVTLTGRGFGSDPARVRVLVGGAAAAVQAVSPTTLGLVVPAACRPLGPVDLQVTVDLAPAAPLVRPFRPAATLDLAPGGFALLRDPATLCLQFAATAADEAYVVGLLNATESPASLLEVAIDARTPPGALPASLLQGAPVPVRPAGRPADPASEAQRRRFDRHARAELQLRQRDRDLARRPAARRGPALEGALIPAGRVVGDTIAVRYSFGGCTSAEIVRSVVRFVGRRGLWLEDITNPVGGYTADDYRQLSDVFDQRIFAVDSAHWGAPSDIDGNGQVAILVTRRVNAEGGILGFVTAADFFPVSSCPRSNVAEIYYAIAPDPQNADPSQRYTRAQGLRDAPLLIAHEFTHIIQFGRRLGAGQAPLEFWEAEGGATLSEQLVGFAAEGRAENGNYDLGVAYAAFDTTRIGWYADIFTDVAQHWGLVCTVRASDGRCTAFGKAPGAPGECSFLATFQLRGYIDVAAPCLGARAAYGMPSLFLRYLADTYGPQQPGGVRGFLQALVGSGQSGLANVAARTGVPADQLLAEFHAMLYLDDRAAVPAPRLTLPTWNLRAIFEGSTVAADGTVRSLRPEARLLPAERPFAAFTDRLAVRGGSSSYLRLSGAGRPGVALQALAPTGGPLPAGARLWVARLR